MHSGEYHHTDYIIKLLMSISTIHSSKFTRHNMTTHPQHATFPCQYLAFSSRYEDRMIDEYKSELERFCDKHSVTPLFIYHDDQVTATPFRDSKVYLDDELSSECAEQIADLSDRLSQDSVYSAIVFKVDDFQKAMEVAYAIEHDINYCCIYGHEGMHLLKNAKGVIDTVVFEVASESG